jgi:hypothetical protein
MRIRPTTAPTIKPLSTALIAKDFVSLYKEVHDDVRMAEKNTPTRVLNLRPSQLPFCVREFFINHARSGLYRHQDLASSYYTSVGHTVHEVMQNYLCRSGRFLADYHCRECGTWHRMSYVHECCDFPTKYHEVEINYKGIEGHIDAVYVDKYGRLWILDFKTTSINGASKKKTNPGAQYVEQIETYAVLFELQYGLKIEGIMDAFILRDNPRKDPVVYAKLLTDEDRKTIRQRLMRYKRMHRQTLDAETWPEVKALLQYARCENELCSVCKFDDETILSRMKLSFKMGRKKGNLPIRAMAEREMLARRKSST